MKITALIMAGGRGERFWPKSRAKLPKQFLSLTDDGETMIQKTVRRISPVVAIEDVFVATNASFKDIVLEQLAGIPQENVLCEPVGRNTAPCIGLGAVHMRKKYEDAVMVVLPSDAMIQQEEDFQEMLRQAIAVAVQEKALVTLGIQPTNPNTGYGYIQYNSDAKLADFHAYAVRRFVEKPDLETAKKYLASGDFLWNSGMFIWRVSDILQQLHDFLPEQYGRLETIAAAIGTEDEQDVLKREFELMTGISIDYGVMEKAEKIIVLPASFDWDDVGSWLAMERLTPPDDQGNLFKGKVISIGSTGCTVQGNEKLIALVGMKDVVIVNTDDVLMVCAKDSVGNIPKVIAELKKSGETDLI